VSNAANRLKPRSPDRAQAEIALRAPAAPEPAHPQLVAGRLTAGDLPGDTPALARALIGKLLVRERAGELLAGRIVETEAYVRATRRHTRSAG